MRYDVRSSRITQRFFRRRLFEAKRVLYILYIESRRRKFIVSHPMVGMRMKIGEITMDPRLSSAGGFHRSRPIYAHLTAIHGRRVRAWSTSSPRPPRAKVRAAESRVPAGSSSSSSSLSSPWEKIFMGALNGNDDFTRESHQLHGVTRYVVLLITSRHFINI